MKYICIALFLLLSTSVEAQNYKVFILNECNLFDDWDCYDRTQAAKIPEILEQVDTAVRNTKYTKRLIIYSIDPIIDRHGDYNFGVRVFKHKIFYAAMPGCPNARRSLERLLRRMKNDK